MFGAGFLFGFALLWLFECFALRLRSVEWHLRIYQEGQHSSAKRIQ